MRAQRTPSGSSAGNRVRLNLNFMNRFNVIWVVQSSRQKYFASRLPQISGYLPFIPHPQEGRFAVVTDVGSGMQWTRRCQQTNDTGAPSEQSFGGSVPK